MVRQRGIGDSDINLIGEAYKATVYLMKGRGVESGDSLERLRLRHTNKQTL